MACEFDIIERYFAPLTMGQAGSAGLKDDAALLNVDPDCELVVTSDTLNEAVHFLEGTDPAYIAKKALRVNLSDLAAKASKPLSYQLNIAFPSRPEELWLKAFTQSLLEDNERYGVYCSGGDTTSIKGGLLSVSITAFGTVERGKAVRRGGAQDGDLCVVTNFLGDAVLGLQALQNALDLSLYPSAIERYLCPDPRTDIREILKAYAHASADISDGVLADSMHIARASGLGLELDLSKIKFSDEVIAAIKNGDVSYEQAIKGGDD